MTQGAPSLSSRLGLARSLLIYYGPVWRRRRIARFYAQFVRPGDLCFDVGAHVGNRVRAWRRLGARVIAVEPQPRCVGVLRTLYGRDSEVAIVASAVGAAPGRTTLHASRSHPALSTTDDSWVEEITTRDRRFAPIAWDEQTDVDLTTLDVLIDRYGEPAFCKIDVEGSELAVLRGLSRALPAISFEFLPASLARAHACIDRLTALGRYQYRWSATETMRWSSPEWTDADGMKAYLAARPAESASGDVYARRID